MNIFFLDKTPDMSAKNILIGLMSYTNLHIQNILVLYGQGQQEIILFGCLNMQTK